MKENFITSLKYAKTFLKWAGISLIVGALGGVVGSLFHKCIDIATETREENLWLIYLLPLGGLAIAALYSLTKKQVDTNRVIESVRTQKDVPWFMAPLIFVGTVITHLLGGSAGREGAALQLGGSIGYNIGKVFGLNEGDMHIIVMSGMSAVFAALFGTPLTAIFFALEVTSVGVMYYAGLIPCIISAFSAVTIAGFFGLSPVKFDSVIFPDTTIEVVIKSIIIAVLCALVCITFCKAIKYCEHYSLKYIKNKYIRAFAGGALVVALTAICRTTDYNGAGMSIIERAMAGDANYEAFALKIIFTAITIAAGFKGGEIVPSFFIGSTFGCVCATLLGLPAGFGAALGFVALFCGVVNCPVASVMLAFEVFGGSSPLIFVLVCGISYMLSGYSGLYKSQKIVYSKLEAKYINAEVK